MLSFKKLQVDRWHGWEQQCWWKVGSQVPLFSIHITLTEFGINPVGKQWGSMETRADWGMSRPRRGQYQWEECYWSPFLAFLGPLCPNLPFRVHSDLHQAAKLLVQVWADQQGSEDLLLDEGANGIWRRPLELPRSPQIAYLVTLGAQLHWWIPSYPLPAAMMQPHQRGMYCNLEEGTSQGQTRDKYLPLCKPWGSPCAALDMHRLFLWHIPKLKKRVRRFATEGIGSGEHHCHLDPPGLISSLP